MVAATYVSDMDASRAFYRLLGFAERSSGKAEASAWSVMPREGVSVLLAPLGRALDIPALPLLFYFFYDDIGVIVGVLEQAGVPVIGTGHPPHALGGEAKVLDPDGNTLLLGQRERPASAAPAADEGLIRFSILAEAAALMSARGSAPQDCQASGRDGGRCPGQAEVKLADSLGDSAWFCLPHAEEILVTVPAPSSPATTAEASPCSWPATRPYTPEHPDLRDIHDHAAPRSNRADRRMSALPVVGTDG